jgi:hypothetical protein
MALAIRKLTIIRPIAAIVSIAAEVDRVVGASAGAPCADPDGALRGAFSTMPGRNAFPPPCSLR